MTPDWSLPHDVSEWTVEFPNDDYYSSMVGVTRWSDVRSSYPGEHFVAFTLRQTPETWASVSTGHVRGQQNEWDTNAEFIALALAQKDGQATIMRWNQDLVQMPDVADHISPGPWTWRVMHDARGELLVLVYTEANEPAPPELTERLAADRVIAVTYGAAESKLTASLESGIRLAALICQTRNRPQVG